MITLRLHSEPETEKFFASRLFLRDKFTFRCPRCRGFQAADILRCLPCTLCDGKGRIDFDITCELIG